MRDFKVRLIRETRNVASCAVRSHKQYYSGGPTEIEVQKDVMNRVQESNTETDNAAFEGQDEMRDEVTSEEEDTQSQEWPEGDTFPLNSKRLNSTRLKQIGEALGVSPSLATRSQLKLMIEGKLTDMGYDPCNVQVIISDCESDKTMIYLVNDEGVIKRIDSVATHVIEESREQNSALRDALAECERLRVEVDEHSTRVRSLEVELAEATATIEQLRNVEGEEEIDQLKQAVKKESLKAKKFWKQRCEQMLKHEEEIDAKDTEIALLKARLLATETNREESVDTTPRRGTGDTMPSTVERSVAGHACRGKAPPVEPFTGEKPDILWEDWIPTFERAAVWNGWEEQDKLLQLAGHLRGKAQREWDMLEPASKVTFKVATKALRDRLDLDGKAVAAQDFRHMSQRVGELVADFVSRLEKTFRRAYGHENMSAETRAALLYGQLHEGLRYSLMKAPAVSGASSYAQLCIAARSEERRQSELLKRQQYQQGSTMATRQGGSGKRNVENVYHGTSNDGNERRVLPSTSNTTRKLTKCWNCDRTGHLAKDCLKPKRESMGRSVPTSARAIKSDNRDDPKTYLLSDSDDDDEAEVKMVRVVDQGSRSQSALVSVGGVLLVGIVDTGADITIIGGDAFKQVASVAKLRKREFKQPDKVPRNYDQQPFHIDGRLDIDIEFQGKTMRTPVYVKMDAPEQLLLSEGVCRQLGIITYHTEVQAVGRVKADQPVQISKNAKEDGCVVPTVRVRLVKDVRILPNECLTTQVKLEGEIEINTQSMIIEADPTLLRDRKMQMVDAVLQPTKDGMAQVSLINCLGLAQKIEGGLDIGSAHAVEVLATGGKDNPTSDENNEMGPGPMNESVDTTLVKTVSSKWEKLEVNTRKEKLREYLDCGTSAGVSTEEYQQVLSFLEQYHDVFSLTESDRGETDLVEMSIETGDATPRKQAARRLPFAVRQEVTRQLQNMQEQKIILPSTSPWASPIVLVRKKDGSLRFCVDYRTLNAVTKPDRFPLPRIDDMLDELGNTQYFSTLDLSSGYWQVRMSEASREKTAFITQQGLFEFCVMPFGLMNAPAVFQRLMQQVISSVNPMEGPNFVSVYIDDLLVYSQTLEEHLVHLGKVMDKLREVNLKLKPSKCHFVRQSVEFLGHILTPKGLQPNPKQVAAVQEFPVPRNVSELRQFLGLTSYYRRFIAQFSRVASPLHNLTRKDIKWDWNEDCQVAFEQLKRKLLTSPILEYPDFEADFVLETDASIQGLGAILSQPKQDDKLHPLAYASRSLSNPERNYSITELETLGVVWAIQHFRAYLYGHNVTVFTDHSAVKAILDKPNSSPKHARWWLKVFGSGISHLKIIHRPGKENAGADALSRNPLTDNKEVTELDASVLQINSSESKVEELLSAPPSTQNLRDDFMQEQRKDAQLGQLIDYIENGVLPDNDKDSKKIVSQALNFVILDKVLYFIDRRKPTRRRAAVPKHLQNQVLQEYHRGKMAGHFSGSRLYATLCYKWWWQNMYTDAISFCRNCAECALATGTGRGKRPPLHPIPVQRPFQIWGVDVMELPRTAKGNKYVIVMQDFLTKWPLVFPAPDQKANRIARLLVDEVLPMFGVPEALLSDRGTNMLANVVQDVCTLLGTTKLNTTAYHPQCDGMVERLNRTLKSMLRKHAVKFGNQWDRYLSGVLWAYRNTPHEATKEKPSYLLFGIDCRSPTEAAFLPTEPMEPIDVTEYREELVLSLSSARELAAANIKIAQKIYKHQYDKHAGPVNFKVGDLVLVKFPHEESGRNRKLSRPWHGPYRIVQRNDPDVTVVKQFFPEEGSIQVHQLRVCRCPQLPIGYYWYGGNRHSAGRTPRWLERMLSTESWQDEDDDGQINLSNTVLGDEHADEDKENGDYDEQEEEHGADIERVEDDGQSDYVLGELESTPTMQSSTPYNLRSRPAKEQPIKQATSSRRTKP